MNQVLAIAGPTASGKSALAIAVAQRFDAVVVSCDAMQIYRGLDIGTGKTTLDEQEGVLHYGIDVRDPNEAFDASDFVRLCQVAFSKHPRVIVAGGTALYLQALRRGLVETPPVDADRRARWEGRSDLHVALAAVDPVLAERLHPNDKVRLIRGLEVFTDTGQRLSDLQAAHAAQPDRVQMRGVWLDREDLFDRIDARVMRMMRDGYLAEVDSLLQTWDRELKPMRSLGYRHLADHLLEGLDLEEAVRRTQRDTRRFARKQRTWHKHLPLEPGDVMAVAEALWEG